MYYTFCTCQPVTGSVCLAGLYIIIKTRWHVEVVIGGAREFGGFHSKRVWSASLYNIYNVDLKAELPVGSKGRATVVMGSGAKPPWNWELFLFLDCNWGAKSAPFSVFCELYSVREVMERTQLRLLQCSRFHRMSRLCYGLDVSRLCVTFVDCTVITWCEKKVEIGIERRSWERSLANSWTDRQYNYELHQLVQCTDLQSSLILQLLQQWLSDRDLYLMDWIVSGLLHERLLASHSTGTACRSVDLLWSCPCREWNCRGWLFQLLVGRSCDWTVTSVCSVTARWPCPGTAAAASFHLRSRSLPAAVVTHLLTVGQVACCMMNKLPHTRTPLFLFVWDLLCTLLIKYLGPKYFPKHKWCSYFFNVLNCLYMFKF